MLEAALLRHRSVLLAMAGRFDESRECERKAGPVLEEAGVESLSWGSLDHASYACALAGDREGAKRFLEAKWRAYPVENGSTQSLAIAAAGSLANLYCDEGRWAEAEAIVAEYRDARTYDRARPRLACAGPGNGTLTRRPGRCERKPPSNRSPALGVLAVQ